MVLLYWKVSSGRCCYAGMSICVLITLTALVVELYYLPFSSICYLPEIEEDTYKSWKTGVVTVLEPDLEMAVNCSELLVGNESEIERVNRSMSSRQYNESADYILEGVIMRNCSWLKDYFSDNLYNSVLEKSFPIAFTFVVYDSPLQVLRLLRILYRHQNTYCIHCDARSEHKDFFQSIADCLDNVIVPYKLESVVWGHYSVLAAQMNCMTALLHFRTKQLHKWNYLLNLCGKELPLVTNREIITRLIKLKGSSSIVAYHTNNSSEYMSRIKYPSKLSKKMKLYMDRQELLGDPPFNISQYYKSQSYVALSYSFTNFLTTNSTAIEVHDFFKKCKNPEEHLYATMFMMPGVPGGYNEKVKHHYFRMEGVFWMNGQNNYTCSGKIVHRICIVGIGDLQNLVNPKYHLFHNKYFMEYDHTVMRCMEELLVERNKLEYHEEHEHC